MTKMDYMYIALVGVFVLGMFIGMYIGRKKAMSEMLYQQQRLEATRMWADSIGRVIGGYHEQR